jgi:NAD+ kinase
MKIAFIASPSPLARESLQELEKRYGQSAIDDADYVVTVGGDGVILKSFSAVLETGKPVFALRRTNSVGFLCNDYSADNLPERLAKAQHVTLHPLHVECTASDGKKTSALALNEITVLRDSPQSAKLSVTIDGVERIARYSGDGLLVATPAGSTAYNHSAGGPIMPLDANTLVMTAICGFRPRRWSYAVLPQDAVVDIKALETGKRPVRIEAGNQTTHNVTEARIRLDHTVSFTLLFDPDAHLGERIVQEQFMT